MKVVVTDNFDSVVKALSKLENSAVTELTKETRKSMRAEIRKNLPKFKSATPVDSGELKRSVKVKSRSKRGVTKFSMVWLTRYAGYVNFARKIKDGINPNSRVITNLFQHNKARLDRDIKKVIVDTQKRFFKSKGFDVK